MIVTKTGEHNFPWTVKMYTQQGRVLEKVMLRLEQETGFGRIQAIDKNGNGSFTVRLADGRRMLQEPTPSIEELMNQVAFVVQWHDERLTRLQGA